MNAYEKRKKAKADYMREYHKKRRLLESLRTHDAKRYYEEAFTSLNGKAPMVIPSVSDDALVVAAKMMYARLHEIEMGE